MTIEFTQESVLANVKVSAFFVIDSSPEGLANKDALFKMVHVDLSKPGNKCVFLYELFFKETFAQNYKIYGVVETTTEWAIAMAQDAINNIYEKIWQYGGKNPLESPRIPITGVFDCATANAMLLPGQIVRGTGVGQIDYLPMAQPEFKWCMENTAIIPDLIEYAVAQHGIADEQLFNKIEQRYEIVTVLQDRFVGAKIPDSCEGIKPTVDTTTGTAITADNEDWTWPIILGSLAGITIVAMAWIAFSPYKKSKQEEEESRSNAMVLRGGY